MKVGYVRVSDDDQTQDLQIDALNAAACDVIYADHGVSGVRTHRKGLDDVLASLVTGDTLVVGKLDRHGRSTVHLLQLLDQLRARGVDFIAITQGIDTTTAVGRMLYGQLAVFAEFEREQISERTRAGMAAAKRRGKHVGRPYKLSESDIAQAIARLGSGDVTVTAMAQSLSVSTKTLRRAVGRCLSRSGAP